MKSGRYFVTVDGEAEEKAKNPSPQPVVKPSGWAARKAVGSKKSALSSLPMAEQGAAEGETAGGIIRSVTRALTLLRDIATSSEAQSFSTLLKRHQLSKGTLHNLLSTLEAQDFIRRNATTGRYRPGFTVMELAASNAANVNGLGTLLEPILEGLVEKCKETCHLGMLNGAEEIILRRIDPRDQIVRVAPQVGRRHPANTTSGGIASLALMDDATVDAVLPAELVQLTKNTINSRSALWRRLKEVRANGYNLDLEEAYLGVRCVAVAVAVRDWPIINVSFTLPLQRAPVEHLRSLAAPLKDAAKRIEAILTVTPHT